jgi:hypothetical protein
MLITPFDPVNMKIIADNIRDMIKINVKYKSLLFSDLTSFFSVLFIKKPPASFIQYMLVQKV